MGAYGNNNSTGKSYIYFGSSSISGNITHSNADVTMTGEATYDRFGYSVSSTGDVNGDGYSDVIVGAWGNNAGGIDAGRSYLYISSSPPIKPRIASVKDITFDEGGYVNVNFVRSGYDATGPNNIITEYLVEMSNPPASGGFSWAQLGTVQPNQNLLYTFNAQTPNDSSANNSGTYFFRITARTADPNQYWRSNIIYGHSVDNLAPGAVQGFAANSVASNTELHWNANTEPDLYNYILYRSSTPTIDLNTASPIANVTGTLFTDTNPPAGEVYYFIVAQDIHNNVSPLATDNILSLAIVDVKIFLEGAYSSPNMTTTLTVPTTSPYSDALTVASIPANVVDWVWIELRNKIDATILEGSRSAFVLSNGKVVHTDGSSTVQFFGATDTQYYIVVKHRNHLGIMTTTPVNVN